MRSSQDANDSPSTLYDVLSDVSLVVLTLGLTHVAMGLQPGTPVRIILGSITLLFIPGYALTTAIFPATTHSEEGKNSGTSGIISPLLGDSGSDTASITEIERVALSFGLSVALIPIYGVIVEIVFGQFTLQPLLTLLTGFILVTLAVGTVQRIRTPEQHRYSVRPFRRLSWIYSSAAQTGRWDLALNIAVVLAIVTAMSTFAFVLAAPQDGDQHTEAYILAQQENGSYAAENYPTDLQMGATENLLVGVKNQEGQPVEYTIVVKMQRIDPDGTVVEDVELSRFQSQVAAGETWQRPHEVTPSLTGDELRLIYFIYKGETPSTVNQQTAYRNISIKVNVTDSGVGDL